MISKNHNKSNLKYKNSNINKGELLENEHYSIKNKANPRLELKENINNNHKKVLFSFPEKILSSQINQSGNGENKRTQVISEEKNNILLNNLLIRQDQEDKGFDDACFNNLTKLRKNSIMKLMKKRNNSIIHKQLGLLNEYACFNKNSEEEKTDILLDMGNFNSLKRKIFKDPNQRSKEDIIALMQFLYLTKLKDIVIMPKDYDNKNIFDYLGQKSTTLSSNDVDRCEEFNDIDKLYNFNIKNLKFFNIAKYIEYIKYTPDTIIYEYGSTPENFYVILNGSVNVYNLREYEVNCSFEDYLVFLKNKKLEKEISLVKRIIDSNNCSKRQNYLFEKIKFENIENSLELLFLSKVKKYLSYNYCSEDIKLLFYENGKELKDYGINILQIKNLEASNSCSATDISELYEKILHSKYLRLQEVKSFQEKNNLEDKFNFTFMEAFKIQSFEKGNFFGDYEIDQDINRINRIKSSEDEEVHLGTLSKEKYKEIILAEKLKIEGKKINYLYSNYFKNALAKSSFAQNYFRFFSFEEYSFNTVLLRENENVNDVYFIIDGKISLSTRMNYYELESKIKNLKLQYKEILSKQNLRLLKLKNPKTRLITNESSEMQLSQEIEKELGNSREMVLKTVSKSDYIGLENVIFKTPFDFKATVRSNKVYLFKASKDLIFKIIKSEGKALVALEDFSSLKVVIILNRLIEIANNFSYIVNRNLAENQTIYNNKFFSASKVSSHDKNFLETYRVKKNKNFSSNKNINFILKNQKNIPYKGETSLIKKNKIIVSNTQENLHDIKVFHNNEDQMTTYFQIDINEENEEQNNIYSSGDQLHKHNLKANVNTKYQDQKASLKDQLNSSSDIEAEIENFKNKNIISEDIQDSFELRMNSNIFFFSEVDTNNSSGLVNVLQNKMNFNRDERKINDMKKKLNQEDIQNINQNIYKSMINLSDFHKENDTIIPPNALNRKLLNSENIESNISSKIHKNSFTRVNRFNSGNPETDLFNTNKNSEIKDYQFNNNDSYKNIIIKEPKNTFRSHKYLIDFSKFFPSNNLRNNNSTNNDRKITQRDSDGKDSEEDYTHEISKTPFLNDKLNSEKVHNRKTQKIKKFVLVSKDNKKPISIDPIVTITRNAPKSLYQLRDKNELNKILSTADSPSKFNLYPSCEFLRKNEDFNENNNEKNLSIDNAETSANNYNDLSKIFAYDKNLKKIFHIKDEEKHKSSRNKITKDCPNVIISENTTTQLYRNVKSPIKLQNVGNLAIESGINIAKYFNQEKNLVKDSFYSNKSSHNSATKNSINEYYNLDNPTISLHFQKENHNTTKTSNFYNTYKSTTSAKGKKGKN